MDQVLRLDQCRSSEAHRHGFLVSCGDGYVAAKAALRGRIVGLSVNMSSSQNNKHSHNRASSLQNIKTNREHWYKENNLTNLAFKSFT